MEESLAATNSFKSSGETNSGHSSLQTLFSENGQVLIISIKIILQVLLVLEPVDRRSELCRAIRLDFP